MNRSAPKTQLESDSNSSMKMIGLDLLGGDGKNGEVDAFERNMEAFKNFMAEDYAAIIASNVGFVLVGREDEITAALRGVSPEVMEHIKIYHQEKQAPMDGTGKEKGNAIDDLAQLQKKGEVIASFTNGSTKHQVMRNTLHLKREQNEAGGKKSPIITKEILPGVFFADNGAGFESSPQGYRDMYETLLAQSGKKNPKVMIFPDDENNYEEIQNLICPEARCVPGDVLAFSGIRGTKPDMMLANGLVGNVYLKLLEVFIKDEAGRNLSKEELSEIQDRVHVLERDENNDWITPDNINLETPYGILSNGEEEKKGTPALQKLRKKLAASDSLGSFRGFIEPKSLVEDKDQLILATPAIAQLIESFTEPSILQIKSDPMSWSTISQILRLPRLLKLKKESAQVVSMAGIDHLNGNIYIGHGAAPQKETEKIFKYLFEKMNQETRTKVGAVLAQ